MLFNSNSNDLNKKLIFGIALNSLFTAFEFSIGIIFGSLALISDASHNLTDVLSLTITFFANKLSQSNPTLKKTFGYGRVTILAALINIFILITLSCYIFYASFEKFWHPEKIEGSIVTVIGFLGILVNGSIASLFLKHKDDLNIKSALANMISDAIASAGALVAGLIIMLTDLYFFDPLISLMIGLMLLLSAWRILKAIVNILLEGVPDHLNILEIKNSIQNIQKVKNIQDLHVWAIGSYESAMICHIHIDREHFNESLEIVKEVKKMLQIKFNIKHSTIEINNDGFCDSICFIKSKQSNLEI